MYCIKCGAKNDNDAKFCNVCGEKMDSGQVQTEQVQRVQQVQAEQPEAANAMGKSRTKKRLPFVILGTVLLVGVILLVIFLVLSASPSAKARKELKLANQYLDEMQYEMAIASFTKAIEIDPKNVDAYEGLASTYVAMAEKAVIVGNVPAAIEYYENAIDILEQGEKETGDQTLHNLRREIEEKKESLEDGGKESGSAEGLQENDNPVMDGNDSEENLTQLLKQKAGGNLVEAFYDDFNGDGQHEMWAVYWEGDGFDYNAWKSNRMDPVFDMLDNRGFPAGDYKQIKIWYVDPQGVTLVDEHTTLQVTEAFVNGQSTYWSRDTFSYLDTLDCEMVSFGNIKQMIISGTYYWRTGRGFDVDSYLLYSYGNENGPGATFSEKKQFDINATSGEVNRFAFVDGHFVYAVQLHSALQSVVQADSSAWATYHYYPLEYWDGSYKEVQSIEIPFDYLYELQNFENVYSDAMDDELLFYTDIIMGSASNVSDIKRTFQNLQPQNVLYNDAGYVYINYIGSVTQTSWVSALADYVTEYLEGEPIMLELKIDGNAIVSYRWVEQYQEPYATDKERVLSDWTKR